MKKLLVMLLSLLSTASPAAEFYEASMNFDLQNVRPFLTRLNAELGLGLDVEALTKFASSIEIGNEKTLSTDVDFKDSTFPLQFHVFMDDIDAPDLYFFTPSEDLAEAIETQFGEFAEEMGL